MKQIRYPGLVAAVAAGMFLFSAAAFCADIKTRIKNRLPRIIELKAAGIIGENNQGFLAFIGGNQSAQALVDAENKDRQLVYDAIAKQQGTTADVVGRRRALQIANKAKPGEWIQDAGGQWAQK